MTDISQPNWSELDDNFNQAPPKGAPEGMSPASVNNTMRAMAGATKRFWDRINGTIATSNIGNSYTLTYPVSPTGPGHGEIFTWKVPATNTGPSTLDPGAGGSKNIVKSVFGGVGAVEAGDFPAGSFVMTAWDSVAAQYVVINTPVAANFSSIAASLVSLEAHINTVSIADAAGGGSAGAAAVSLDARITSQSALWTANLNNTSLDFVAADRSVSLAIKTDMNSISSIITSSFIANDASVSSVVTTAYVSADRSTSSVIRAGIGNMLAVAYVSFIGTDPPSQVGGSSNILSVSRSAAGIYRVRFSPLLDVTRGLAVVGTAQLGDINPTVVTASAVKFFVFDYNVPAAVSGGYVSLVVFGNS